MATTTGNIAPRVRKKKRKKRMVRRSTMGTGMGLVSKVVGMPGGEGFREQVLDQLASQLSAMLFEKKGHSRTGGKKMLKALFTRGVLGKKVAPGVYLGWKGRKYRVKKVGDSRFKVTRIK